MTKLNAVFPQVAHVSQFALSAANDVVIWDFAKQNNYCIVSKDSDFRNKSFLHGAPPKIIWVSPGECTTEGIHLYFKVNQSKIHDFLNEPLAAILMITILKQ